MIARLDFGGPQFYLTDRQGSVLQIVGTDGATVKRVVYKGTDTFEHHEVQAGYVDRFEFAGRSFDRQTHLQLYGSRWLIASAGRFLTESGDGTNLHPYAFAGDNSVNKVKPGENDFTTWYGDLFHAVTGLNKQEGRGWVRYYTYNDDKLNGEKPGLGRTVPNQIVVAFVAEFGL